MQGKNDYLSLIRGGNLSRSQATQEDKEPKESLMKQQKELCSIAESLKEGESQRKKNDKSISQDASIIKITNPKYLDDLIQSALIPESRESKRRMSYDPDSLSKNKEEDNMAPNIFDQFNMSILKQKGEWGKNSTGIKFLPSLVRARKPDFNQLSKEFDKNLYKMPRDRFPRSLLLNSQSFKKLPGTLMPLNNQSNKQQNLGIKRQLV